MVADDGHESLKGHLNAVRFIDMSVDYYVYLVCPRCFRSKWVLRRGLDLALEEVLNTFWEFKCPVHGLLREKPLQASPRNHLQALTQG